MINSRLFNFILRTVLFLFLSGVLIVITLSFVSFALYSYLNSFFTPIISSLIVSGLALTLSIIVLLIFRAGKAKTSYGSNEIESVKKFVEDYPRVSVLTVFLIGFILTGKKTFKYLFEILFKYITKEEVMNFVAKKV